MATLALARPLSTTALTENQFTSRWDSPETASAALMEPRAQEFTFLAAASVYHVVLRNAIFRAALPKWVKPTISAYAGIQDLSDNWDSYRGKATDLDLINQSLALLGAVMQHDSPVPSVVPMGDGGLQIEWHRHNQDLEIMFAADEAPSFFYRDRATGFMDEGSTSENDKLIRFLRNLA
jgi:hypothetical protein